MAWLAEGVEQAAIIPGNLIQALLGAWVFRALRADPCLNSARDWLVWIGFGVLLANLLGAVEGSLVQLWAGRIAASAFPKIVFGWWVGNSVPSLIIGSLLLKLVSPLVIQSRAFVEGWLA